MDYELLVDDKTEEGRALIAGLVGKGFDVSVALWVKTSEEGRWFLYIGTTALRTMSLADAYVLVFGILGGIPDAGTSISEIKLIDPNDPIARRAMDLRDRHSGNLALRYRGRRFGSLAIEEAYIYPRTGEMTRSEVLQAVTGLVNRTGALAPSLVTLRDGTRFQAVPVGIQMNQPGAIQVMFQDLDAGANRSVPVDDVLGIR